MGEAAGAAEDGLRGGAGAGERRGVSAAAPVAAPRPGILVRKHVVEILAASAAPAQPIVIVSPVVDARPAAEPVGQAAGAERGLVRVGRLSEVE